MSCKLQRTACNLAPQIRNLSISFRNSAGSIGLRSVKVEGVKNIEKTRNVQVNWQDGHASLFNGTWLRVNCPEVCVRACMADLSKSMLFLLRSCAMSLYYSPVLGKTFRDTPRSDCYRASQPRFRKTTWCIIISSPYTPAAARPLYCRTCTLVGSGSRLQEIC